MIQRVLLASVVAGVAAGIALTALQSVGVAPLLFAAETYETGVGDPGLLPHPHGELTHSHARRGSCARARRPCPRFGRRSDDDGGGR